MPPPARSGPRRSSWPPWGRPATRDTCATAAQTAADWVGSLIGALEFAGGVPRLIGPDQPRALIVQPDRYEPGVGRLLAEFCDHYGVAVLPARPAHPRDKPKVENTVLVVERWILARLRNRRFFSLAELNTTIRELVADLNARPFKKLPGCRREAFERLDRPALRPLPSSRMPIVRFKSARVNIDYHVELDGHYYSVPHRLFVQAAWDMLEQMKPAAQAAHYRMFGYHFAEITAEPVQTPFGEYRGGYVPAIADSLLVPEARAHGTMDDMLSSQNSPMFPAVNRGFTKSRVEAYNRPLALDLRLLPAHIDKVARFSVLGPVLRDAARLVTRNRAFREAMNAVDPTAVESLLAPWLKRVATQTLTKAPETQADRAVARIANQVRNRTGLLLMAGNVVNTLQQITGLSVAALRVKPRHLAAGLVQYLRNPTSTARAIGS